jgi:hypothetical protein
VPIRHHYQCLISLIEMIQSNVNRSQIYVCISSNGQHKIHKLDIVAGEFGQKTMTILRFCENLILDTVMYLALII